MSNLNGNPTGDFKRGSVDIYIDSINLHHLKLYMHLPYIILHHGRSHIDSNLGTAQAISRAYARLQVES